MHLNDLLSAATKSATIGSAAPPAGATTIGSGAPPSRPMLFDQSTITSSSSSSAASSASSDVVSSEPYVKASIRERTMDVMSVVGVVLFGVGCGALTAATMYLFWSLFVPRRFGVCSDDDDSGDEAYVAVASATKEVPPSADEIDRIAAMK